MEIVFRWSVYPTLPASTVYFGLVWRAVTFAVMAQVWSVKTTYNIRQKIGYTLASALGISASHLSEMKHGKRSCSAEYGLRLSRYFGTSEGFWLRLQTAYQLRIAKAKKGASIEKEVSPLASV